MLGLCVNFVIKCKCEFPLRHAKVLACLLVSRFALLLQVEIEVGGSLNGRIWGKPFRHSKRVEELENPICISPEDATDKILGSYYYQLLMNLLTMSAQFLLL